MPRRPEDSENPRDYIYEGCVGFSLFRFRNTNMLCISKVSRFYKLIVIVLQYWTLFFIIVDFSYFNCGFSLLKVSTLILDLSSFLHSFSFCLLF